MKYKFITVDGPEYPAERMLRWEVLDKPLGIPPGTEILPEELQSLHLIALDGKRLVGCVCFYPEGKTYGRIFEMAVSQDYQGNGFTRQLLHHLEKMLVERGIHDVYLYASPDVEEFYSMMGYLLQTESVVKMGMKHHKMKKNLRPAIESLA